MNRILKKLTTARLALMAALFGSALSASADESVYISDFSIKAGEQKEIAVNFDSESTDFKYVEGTVKLPAGLVLVKDAYEGASWKSNARGNASRVKDPYANMNPATGKIIIASAQPPITGKSGAVGYITVVSTRDLKEVSKINLSGFKAVKEDGTEVSVPASEATVTRSTPLAWLQFTKDSQVMHPGDTVAVDVEMTNVVDITFLQQNLSVSEGLTITGVKKAERTSIELWNAETGVYIIDTISGSKGVVYTVSVAADKDFIGNAAVYAKKIVASDEDAVTYKPADITLPVYVLIPDGPYYFQNVATGKFLAAGHDWGTRAIVDGRGLDFTLAGQPNGKYTLDSRVTNGGNSHFLGDNLYTDAGAFQWTIEKAGDKLFTISKAGKTDGQFITADADGNIAWTTDSALWKLYTPAELLAERLKTLEAATAENPVDATFLVQAPNFNRNDQRNAASWTVVAGSPNLSGGNNLNNNAESYMAAFEINQTLSGLPAGYYKVEAQAAVTFHDNRVIKEYDGNGYPVIFAGEATSDFNEMEEGDRLTSMGQMSDKFTAGMYEVKPIIVKVEDGTLKIGAKSDRADIWAVWDNFRLTYLSADYAPVQPDEPAKEAPEGWTLAVTNGNLAGDDLSSYVSKEAPSADIVPARIVAGAGKDGSRGIVVQSADEVGKDGAQDWDSQFWIVLNEKLPQGTKLHVEFDYKASQAAKAATQAHGNPGSYQHWAAIGDVNFTTEWQHFSTDIEVSGDMATGQGGTGLLSIAFNLAVERTATEYCLDNFGVWYQKPAPVEEWKDIITNGTMEGTDVVNFFKTESTVGPVLAEISDGIGKDGGRAIKVQSGDSPSQNWDTQFFIRLPFELAAGTKFRISFDYKADKDAASETQSHNEPGQYIHWACVGSPSFTAEWQHYEYEGTVASQCDGTQADGGYLKNFQTIAFNLALNKVATEFIFDNVKFEVEKSVWETGIRTVNATVKAADGAIYDLRGRKVEGALRKGVYIQNGRKIMVK